MTAPPVDRSRWRGVSPQPELAVLSLGSSMLRVFALPGWFWGALAVPAIALRIAYWERRGGPLGDYCAGVLFWVVSLGSLAGLHWSVPVVLALGGGLTWVLEGWIYRRLRPRVSAPISATLAIVSAEVLRAVFPMQGMPLSRVGSGLVDSPLASVGSLIGESGMSLLATLCGGAAFALFTRERPRYLAIAAAALAAASVTRLGSPPPRDGSLRSLAVQTDVTANPIFSDLGMREKLSQQAELFERGLERHPDTELVVWPESGLPMMAVPEEGSGRIRRPLRGGVFDQPVDGLRRLQRDAVAGLFPDWADPPWLLTGAQLRYPIDPTQGSGEMSPFTNELILFEPGGRIVNQARKEILVPFAETLPFQGRFPMSSTVARVALDLIGYDPRASQLAPPGPMSEAGLPTLGTAICWDVVFERLFRRQSDQGANAFVVVSNEMAFSGGIIPDQLVAATRWRALETGRSVLKVGTVGGTMLIDGSGRIVERLAFGARDFLAAELALTHDSYRTPYMQWGWLLTPALCALAMLAAFWPSGAGHPRSRGGSP